MLRGAPNAAVAVVAHVDGGDLAAAQRQRLVAPAADLAAVARAFPKSFADHHVVAPATVDGLAVAHVDVECKAVAEFVQQGALEGAQHARHVVAVHKRRDGVCVAMEEAAHGVAPAQHLHEQFVDVEAGEQTLAGQAAHRNGFVAQDVDQFAAPAPGDDHFRERFDWPRAPPGAPRPAHDAADQAMIPGEQFDDDARLAERAPVQHMRRLALGGGEHQT